MAQTSQMSGMRLQVLGVQAETWGAWAALPRLPSTHPAPTTHPMGFSFSHLFFSPPIPGYFISPHPAALPWERGGNPSWMRLSRRCAPGACCQQPAPRAGYGPRVGCTPRCEVTHCTYTQDPQETPAPIWLGVLPAVAPQIHGLGSIHPCGVP